MSNYIKKYGLFLALIFCASCQQNHIQGKKTIVTAENKGLSTPYGPGGITRNIIQDRNGNIWIAAFDGVFK